MKKAKIGSFGKLGKTGYFAVGNNELENQPIIGKFTICPKCKKSHKVEYGKNTTNGEINTTVGFVNCGKKLYLVAVNGKVLI